MQLDTGGMQKKKKKKKRKKERKNEKLKVRKHAVEFGQGYQKRRDKLNLFSLVLVFRFWQV